MRECRKLFSCSIMDYGDRISVEISDRNSPVFVGNRNNSDMGFAFMNLVFELLYIALKYDHTDVKDFCVPKYDNEEQVVKFEKYEE